MPAGEGPGGILFFRGGGLGDFIVTLPVLRALRLAHPEAPVAVVARRPMEGLVVGRRYAGGFCDLEDTALAGLHLAGGGVGAAWRERLAAAAHVVSFVPDPAAVMEAAFRRLTAGAVRVHRGGQPVTEPAPRHFARVLDGSGVAVTDFTPRLFPSARDLARGAELASGMRRPLLLVHPGSGSPRKNLEPAIWAAALERVRAETGASIGLICGEADEAAARGVEARMAGGVDRIFRGLRLWELAGLLARAQGFAGHDSGVSHLAAAVGAQVTAVFGPTNPRVWAPAGESVRVFEAGLDLGRATPAALAREIAAGVKVKE